jgi:hypothetical protein
VTTFFTSVDHIGGKGTEVLQPEKFQREVLCLCGDATVRTLDVTRGQSRLSVAVTATNTNTGLQLFPCYTGVLQNSIVDALIKNLLHS